MAAHDRDGDGGLGIDDRLNLAGVRRFSHEAMATVFEVLCAHPDARYAAQAAQDAFDLTDQLERDLSRFIPNSDISRINRLAAGGVTRVGPATIECLVIARHMFDVTGGAFDVSIGTGLPALEVDPGAGTVRAGVDGVRIDLGGIGKGYAVDLMAERLEDWGIGTALVHGGFSSVLALDAPPAFDGWPLTLSDPLDSSRVLVRLSVRQTVLGASGLRKGAHIVDPRTGAAPAGRVAAWVALPRPEEAWAGSGPDGGLRVAPAAVADALTTAVMVMRTEAVAALCEGSPGLEAWILETPAEGQAAAPVLVHVGAASAGIL